MDSTELRAYLQQQNQLIANMTETLSGQLSHLIAIFEEAEAEDKEEQDDKPETTGRVGQKE